MDLAVVNRSVALLGPDELTAALRCVTVLEKAGELPVEEAAEWRRRIRGRAAFLEPRSDEEPSG